MVQLAGERNRPRLTAVPPVPVAGAAGACWAGSVDALLFSIEPKRARSWLTNCRFRACSNDYCVKAREARAGTQIAVMSGPAEYQKESNEMQATLTRTARPTARTSILPSIGLWVLQVLLAAVFLLHGILLLFPPAEMLAMINAQMGEGLRLLIGVAEVLGAVGLIGPGATRILPKLTPLAAAGLMIIMGGATVWHAIRGESVIVVVVLLALLAVVAYTRWRVRPFVVRQRAQRG